MSKNRKKSKFLIICRKIRISAYLRLTGELPLPDDMLAGILEAMSRFLELPSPSSSLPFDQFHRHLQKFLLAPSVTISGSGTHGPHLYLQPRKLSSPNHLANPCPQNEHTCRFHRRGQHFHDCGPSAKADFQTRPLLAAS